VFLDFLQVVGIEFAKISSLSSHIPAGSKILIKDVIVRRGNNSCLLMRSHAFTKKSKT